MLFRVQYERYIFICRCLFLNGFIISFPLRVQMCTIDVVHAISHVHFVVNWTVCEMYYERSKC